MKILIRSILALTVLWSSALFAAEFVEGSDYVPIQPAPPQQPVGSKVQVTEFFMYSCPHCYHFEPVLDQWLKHKPADVDFVRVPVLFGGPSNMQAQVYYALQAMGEAKRMTPLIFHAIHAQRKNLRSLPKMEAFLAANGVDMSQFKKAMASFGVAAKTNQVADMMRRYAINVVPTLVVDGRYKSGKGLNHQQMTELASFLVEKVKAERKAVAEQQ